MPRDDPALEVRERSIEQRDARVAAPESHALEAIALDLGEPARDLLLAFRQDADAEMLGGAERLHHARRLVDAGEDERRREADRAERAGGHPVILVPRASGEHRDPAGEATEHAAKE